ncbi:MAG: phage/plasmid primase, P4 family [Acutalibacteraceae bacterium]
MNLEEYKNLSDKDLIEKSPFREIVAYLGGNTGSENAITLQDLHDFVLMKKYTEKDIEECIEELRRRDIGIWGNAEQGYYHPNEYDKLVEIGKENPFDERIIDHAKSLCDVLVAQTFLNQFSDFAKKLKKKTDFDNLTKNILSVVKKNQKRSEAESSNAQYQQYREQLEASLPEWIYLDKKDNPRVDEPKYISVFLEKFPMAYIDGRFISIDEGKIEDNFILHNIQEHSELGIKFHINSNLSKITNNILNALKATCYKPSLVPNTGKIYFPNGCMVSDSSGHFTQFNSGEKDYCLNRIQTPYKPTAEKPVKFLSYLSDMLEDDDIETLQQWLGSIFIPNTKTQLCLYIYGNGEEGKSQLGVILKGILGEQNMFQKHIQELENNRFVVANISEKLLFLDDDVESGALQKSGVFKSLVTQAGKSDFERKYVQESSGYFYAKFLLFGNFPLQSLYDSSDGFYRRYHNIRTKPKRADRHEIKDIAEVILAEETDAILNWLLDGLNKLISNNWKPYISERSKKVSDELKYSNDTIEHFLNSEYVELNDAYGSPTRDLYTSYIDFCSNNGFEPLRTANAFSGRLNSKAKKYNLTASTNIPDPRRTGRRIRGYKGIGINKLDTTSGSTYNTTKSVG